MKPGPHNVRETDNHRSRPTIAYGQSTVRSSNAITVRLTNFAIDQSFFIFLSPTSKSRWFLERSQLRIRANDDENEAETQDNRERGRNHRTRLVRPGLRFMLDVLAIAVGLPEQCLEI